MVLADFGDKVSPFPVEKLSMAKGQKLTCGILTKKIRIVKYHYIKGVGYWHCFDALCCDVAGIPNVRYVFPIVVYPCDMEGEPTIKVEKMTIADVEFKSLVVGNDDYSSLLTKDQLQQRSHGSITKIDMMLICTDSEFQKKDYETAGPCMWRKFLTKQDVIDALTYWNKNAELSIARFLTEEKLQLALTENRASTPVQDRPESPATKALTGPVVEQDLDLNEFFDEEDFAGTESEQIDVKVSDSETKDTESLDDIEI